VIPTPPTRQLTPAEAHVLALLNVAGPSTDHHIAFLYPLLEEGGHWTPLTDAELMEAREALARDGLVEDTGVTDWKGRAEWSAV
jgi:hypothetical protein